MACTMLKLPRLPSAPPPLKEAHRHRPNGSRVLCRYEKRSWHSQLSADVGDSFSSACKRQVLPRSAIRHHRDNHVEPCRRLRPPTCYAHGNPKSWCHQDTIENSRPLSLHEGASLANPLADNPSFGHGAATKSGNHAYWHQPSWERCTQGHTRRTGLFTLPPK